jgi:hypothetical protein
MVCHRLVAHASDIHDQCTLSLTDGISCPCHLHGTQRSTILTLQKKLTSVGSFYRRANKTPELRCSVLLITCYLKQEYKIRQHLIT